jgi:hypothetical protein
MMMIRKLLRCLAALILVGIVFQSTARAEDSTAAKAVEKAKPEPADAIRQALTKKIEWNFEEMPLADVAEVLHKELKIPIRLDTKALNDLGITPETTITFKMSGISAKTALKLLLGDLGLTTIIDDEVLIITSPDVADCQLITVIYDVSDLPAYRRANGKTVPDYDALSDVITRTIKPTTWDEVGGQGSVQPFESGEVQALVVSQTREVQDEILNLLAGLRKLRQWPLGEKEIEKLPIDPGPNPQSQGMGMHGMGGHGGMGMNGMGGQGPHGGGPGRGVPAASNPGAGETGGKDSG